MSEENQTVKQLKKEIRNAELINKAKEEQRIMHAIKQNLGKN